MNDSFENTLKIVIIGLGYVGLPLARQFSKVGICVVGLDVDQKKIQALNAGKSYIKHIDSAEIRNMIDGGCFQASTDFQLVAEADAVLICVPTPLSRHREPDLSYVLDTAHAIAPHLKRGVLVCLESTTYPGTTDEDLRRVLEEGSNLEAGVDFHLAYSPEREDPGNPHSQVSEIPKVIGGFTEACREKAIALYELAVKQTVPVSSCRAAEATKLLENIFRSVNIALVNELKMVFHEMNIDVWEVINAAKTKPFGYMPFYPGPGLGGHCIPIDPFYLTWKAREYGENTRFIELAGEINSRMPEYVVHRTTEALNAKSRAVRGSRILLVGLAYKPDVDDMRESPTFALMDLFDAKGAEISYFDPFIPEITQTREHSRWTGMKSIPWDRDHLDAFNAAVIATHHSGIDYNPLLEAVDPIIDTRNALSDFAHPKDGQVWKA